MTLDSIKSTSYFKERYPQFFSDELIEFYCLDGWADLLDAGFALIAELDYHFKLIQVKEKLGGLRIYCKGDPESKEICNWMMSKSYEICSECSSRDGVKTEGDYLVTLCKVCREKEE